MRGLHCGGGDDHLNYHSIDRERKKDVCEIVTCCWLRTRGQVGPRAKNPDHKSIGVAVACRLRRVPDHGQSGEARSKSHLPRE